MHWHLCTPNGELTLTGIALCGIGLCFLAGAIAGLIKLVKG